MPAPLSRPIHGQHPAERFSQRYATAKAADLVAAADETFKGQLAIVSSFGAEAAILLHLVAQVNPALPVLTLDTEHLFPETVAYRSELVARLGLTDVRVIRPDAAILAKRDPQGTLWQYDVDACCTLRKVEPLRLALEPFQAWISGRKRYQAASRALIPVVERDGDKTKINPLAAWTRDDIERHMEAHALHRHPLEAERFLSIGCVWCTDRVEPGEDLRAGRWRGNGNKTECGIHLPVLRQEPEHP